MNIFKRRKSARKYQTAIKCLCTYKLSLDENKEKEPIASIPAVSALSMFDPSDIPMKKSGYLAL